MPKVKNHIIETKKDYSSVAFRIFVAVFCCLIIGRVGKIGVLGAIVVGYVLGDFATLVLAFIIVCSVSYILFKKKIDFHHISFIGFMFIYVAFSMYAHLGLYEPLGMVDSTVLSKTIRLYRNYLYNYEFTYCFGGGIVAAIFVQIAAYLLGKTGTILLGICFILIGISFFAHMNFISFLRGGKIKEIPRVVINYCKNYIEHIHYPNIPKKNALKKRVNINMLDDHDEGVSFTLQNEINKERFDEFKKFVKDNKMYCFVDAFYTSYSCSRFTLRVGMKNDDDIKKINSFFNRNCFYLKEGSDISLEFPNQFRKLLTLKNVLMSDTKNMILPVAVDVDNSVISLDMNKGRLIVVVGEENSGVKTFIRSFLISIFMKNIAFSNVYFYDLYEDFNVINNTSIKYINNIRSAGIALDEAFNEYERRSEILKYLDADNILEANQIIKKNHPELEVMLAEFHILYLDLSSISSSLLQKISYAIRFTLRVGIHIIVCCRTASQMEKLDLNNCDIIAFKTSDVGMSLKLFSSDMACRLLKKGDCLIISDGKTSHGQAPYISISDFNDIVKKI